MYQPKEGDRFISLDQKLAEIRLLTASKDKEDGKLYAAYYQPAVKPKMTTKKTKAVGGQKAKWVQKPIEEIPGPFMPSFMFQRQKYDGLDSIAEAYSRIFRAIEQFIAKANGYFVPIENLESYLKELGEVETDYSPILKLLVAEGIIFRLKVLDAGNTLGFTQIRADLENSRKYFGSLAEELASKSKKISWLIAHSQTAGNYREYILRSFLRSILPTKFEVATGFIEGIPYQIDILIYDAHNHSPTFRDGELVVVRRESIRAIIEVKTNLISAKLQEALQLFYEISRPGIFKPDLPIFKGVFAFDTTYVSASGLSKAVKSFYTKPVMVEALQEKFPRDIMYLYHEVTCINVVNKVCVLSKYEDVEGKGRNIPTLWSIGNDSEFDIQTAVFLSMLFDFLDVDFYAKKSLFNSFKVLIGSSIITAKRELALTKLDWLPRTWTDREHERSDESIAERLSKIQDWFTGDLSTVEYLKDLRTE